MAANWVFFENELQRIFRLKQSNNFDEFSVAFSNLFTKSTIGLATTTTGNPLVSANYSIIQSGIKSFLDFNFNINANLQFINSSIESLSSLVADDVRITEIIYRTSRGESKKVFLDIPTTKKIPSIPDSDTVLQLPENLHPLVKQALRPYTRDLNNKLKLFNPENQDSIDAVNLSLKKLKDFILKINIDIIPYLFLESTFILFWSSATFGPLPPVPPTIAPLFGTKVLLPGIPGILSVFFKLGFTAFDSALAASLIRQGIELHSKTITGTYSGLIVTPTGTIPAPPIPWVGII